MRDLKDISTRDLVEELSRREGVKTNAVTPYAKLKVEVEGPIIVLIVED